MSESNNLLSFIFVARNDDYTDDYIFRLSYSINFLSKQIKDLNLIDQVKIEIVDWGSKKKLSDSLLVQDEDYNKIISFYEVDESITNEFDKLSIGNFFVEMACNVGFRRSQSKFLLNCPADQILTKSSLNNLYNFLKNYKGNEFFFTLQRKILDNFYFEKNFLEIDILNQFLEDQNFFSNHFNSNRVYYSGGTGGILAKKKDFIKIRGYDENILFRGRYGGADNYTTKKFLNFLKLSNLTNRGIFFFKLPYSYKGTRSFQVNKNKMLFKCKNYYQFSDNFNYNFFEQQVSEIKPNPLKIDQENWGLNDKQINKKDGNIRLKANYFHFNENHFYLKRSIKINFFKILKLVETWFFFKNDKSYFYDFIYLYQLISRLNILSVIFINTSNPNIVFSVSKISPFLNLVCVLKSQYLNFGDMWFNLTSKICRTHKGYFRSISDTDFKDLDCEIVNQFFSNLIIIDENLKNVSQFINKSFMSKNLISFIFVNKKIKKEDYESFFNKDFIFLKNIKNYKIFINKNLNLNKIDPIEEKKSDSYIFKCFYMILKLVNPLAIAKWKVINFLK
jgi:hypothetical protein